MTNIFPQGTVDFSVGYKTQTTWGFQEGLTFVLEGVGATLFFAALLADNVWGMAAGVVVLGASGVLLMMHLGRPRNMIYVMANFRHSWMSRGAVLIPAFIGLGVPAGRGARRAGPVDTGGWRVAIEIVFLAADAFYGDEVWVGAEHLPGDRVLERRAAAGDVRAERTERGRGNFWRF